MADTKLRDILATIWNEDELITFKKLCTQYWICGEEVCPTTGKLHWQSYGQFGKQIRLKTLQKKMPNTNLIIRRGSVEENRIYCSKDKKFEEFGEPKSQGQRSDIKIVKDMVKTGATMEQIFDELDNPNYQSVKCAELLRKYICPKRNAKPEVIWIFGETGSGKTRWSVNEMGGEDFWMSSGTLQWWDGYDMQKNVIIDDFRGSQCEFSKLLRYLDRYEVRVPIKGGMVPLMATKIIITSCHSPKGVYDNEKINENIGQLIRRCDKILGMLQNGDIVDQTELMKS